MLGASPIQVPEWCEVTVYRLGRNGERMPYPGPRVYWLETYALGGLHRADGYDCPDLGLLLHHGLCGLVGPPAKNGFLPLL
jgi:hypothetical protein